jgi:hypothetical protein
MRDRTLLSAAVLLALAVPAAPAAHAEPTERAYVQHWSIPGCQLVAVQEPHVTGPFFFTGIVANGVSSPSGCYVRVNGGPAIHPTPTAMGAVHLVSYVADGFVDYVELCNASASCENVLTVQVPAESVADSVGAVDPYVCPFLRAFWFLTVAGVLEFDAATGDARVFGEVVYDCP